MRNTQGWFHRLEARIAQLADGNTAREEMTRTNASMIERATRGMGPDKNTPVPELGARMAVNLAAVHVPKLCAGPDGQTYKNAYDLGNAQLIGSLPAGAIIPLRMLVDDMLSDITGVSPKQIYFGAVELNGCGIRFYGDVCLVLKPEVVNDSTIVLISNSYDLVRPPVTPTDTIPSRTNKLENHAQAMAGDWGNDLPAMGALKTFAMRPVTERRLTTGQISAAVLEDEDYLEILKVNSFKPCDLQEARVSAADTAAETRMSEYLQLGRCPSLAELQWRKHRRAAAAALGGKGVHTRVITTSGRVRP